MALAGLTIERDKIQMMLTEICKELGVHPAKAPAKRKLSPERKAALVETLKKARAASAMKKASAIPFLNRRSQNELGNRAG